MTHRGGAVANLRRADRLLARADALDPVPLVVIRRVAVPFFVADRRLDGLRGVARDLVSRDANRPALAHKDAIGLTAVDHLDAVRIDEAKLGIALFRRMDVNWARVVHVERPLRDIEMVSAHIGHLPAGEFLIFTPSRKVIVNRLGAQFVVKTPFRGWTKPEVPVNPVRQRLRRQVARLGRPADADADRLQFANPAVADQFDRQTETIVELASLLTARLENDVILRNCFDDPPTFSNVVSERFFAVDVLFRLSREDARNGMPVVRGRDDDGVDVLAFDDLPKVAVSVAEGKVLLFPLVVLPLD